MRQVVLDTSVIAKLFLDEPYSEKALEIKDGHLSGELEVLAPSLLKYELVNTLIYKRFKSEEVKEAVEVITDYGFSFVELDSVTLNRIVELSVKYGITAYDAAYVAVGSLSDADVYTADEKLLGRVKKLNFVKHLRDYE
jgi:predicted nucleic acid-binding protein